MQSQLIPRENSLLNSEEKDIIRVDLKTHLAKYPYKSDVENWIVGKSQVIAEDAISTLDNIFQSCKNFEELVCHELLHIWLKRRENPLLILQPNQWQDKIKPCNFLGYDLDTEPPDPDIANVSRVLIHRMLAASVLDGFRDLWNNSKWKK